MNQKKQKISQLNAWMSKGNWRALLLRLVESKNNRDIWDSLLESTTAQDAAKIWPPLKGVLEQYVEKLTQLRMPVSSFLEPMYSHFLLPLISHLDNEQKEDLKRMVVHMTEFHRPPFSNSTNSAFVVAAFHLYIATDAFGEWSELQKNYTFESEENTYQQWAPRVFIRALLGKDEKWIEELKKSYEVGYPRGVWSGVEYITF